MRQINVFEKGDRVAIEYEVDSLIFKNGTIYYKLKEIKKDGAISYLPNAYTADELTEVIKDGQRAKKYDIV